MSAALHDAHVWAWRAAQHQAREEALRDVLMDIAHHASTASRTLDLAIASDDADAAEAARCLVSMAGFIADKAAQQLGDCGCQCDAAWLYSPRTARALELLQEREQ